jgi:hypothetical protein
VENGKFIKDGKTLTKSLFRKKMNLGIMQFCTKKFSRLTSGILARKAGIQGMTCDVR